jgi:8-oxo-dGTP pyrophosphatase MutT (NUDIX family)
MPTSGNPQEDLGSSVVVATPGRIIARRSSVVVLLLDGSDAIVVQQWRRSVGQETVELVQEQIEDDESPEMAAYRGVWEECGLQAVRLIEHGSFWGAPAYSTQRVHVFSAEIADAETNGAPRPIRTRRCALSDVDDILDDAISIAALSLFRRSSQLT